MVARAPARAPPPGPGRFSGEKNGAAARAGEAASRGDAVLFRRAARASSSQWSAARGADALRRGVPPWPHGDTAASPSPAAPPCDAPAAA